MGLHETHVCRDCGASITVPYAAPAVTETADPRPRCAACGRVCVVEFYAPPDLWDAAAREYASTHLCITCFDERLPEPVGWEAVTVLSGISRWRAMEDAP